VSSNQSQSQSQSQSQTSTAFSLFDSIDTAPNLTKPSSQPVDIFDNVPPPQPPPQPATLDLFGGSSSVFGFDSSTPAPAAQSGFSDPFGAQSSKIVEGLQGGTRVLFFMKQLLILCAIN